MTAASAACAARLIHDHGAYTARGVNVPYGSGSALTLSYQVPALRLNVKLAITNKVPVTPVRGAGQPQGVFVMERLLDRVARELKLDRAEVRRRNLVPAEKMPYPTPLKTRGGMQVVLDSGNYPACQALALAEAGWDGFPARQAGRARTRPLSRHRTRQLCGRHRPRPVRAGHGADRPLRQDPHLFGRGRYGPEHQDHAGADRRRTVRRRHGEHDRHHRR